MGAIVQDHYGEVDALELRDIAQPTIGDDEVLIRVTPPASIPACGTS